MASRVVLERPITESADLARRAGVKVPDTGHAHPLPESFRHSQFVLRRRWLLALPLPYKRPRPRYLGPPLPHPSYYKEVET